ncbi:MAG TPA: methyltransferase domain-containing protein [Pirellulales bacterium]
MNEFLAGVARAALETFSPPEPVLEIGSYQPEGQQEIANLRPLLAGKKYTGVDMRPGPGVDSVENVEKLERPDASVGTVLALSVFEHVERFWLGFSEIERVLRPDGLLVVSCPFYFHIHHHPSDYWRFTPEALESLLRGYAHGIVGWHGPKNRPLNVWAVAAKSDHPAFSASQRAAFHERIGRYAKQPLGLMRRLRYGLGRVIAGPRLFGPVWDAERFDTRPLKTA